MRLAGFTLTPFRLPLRAPWRNSRGTHRERRGWLITLNTREGLTGHGECAPLPAAGTETPPQARHWLQRRLACLPGRGVEETLAGLPPADGCPAARCALETALLDLLSQAAGQPLRRWLEPDAGDRVRLNAALGAAGGELAVMARGALGEGFKTLKIKVGTAPPARELGRIRDLVRALPAGIRLRLDANRAWTAGQAERFVEGLASLPVESLEEPLATPEPGTLARLQALARFDIALDESLSDQDLERLLADPPIRRIVLKPPARGGLLPALELARRARAASLTCIVTSCLDAAVGIWAAAQLAAAVDLPAGQAHGLATSGWFRQDIGAPPPPGRGQFILPERPGLGFSSPHPATAGAGP